MSSAFRMEGGLRQTSLPYAKITAYLYPACRKIKEKYRNL